jgi:hypothetical protein
VRTLDVLNNDAARDREERIARLVADLRRVCVESKHRIEPNGLDVFGVPTFRVERGGGEFAVVTISLSYGYLVRVGERMTAIVDDAVCAVASVHL